MKSVYFILILLLCLSCEEDDTNLICSTDCTTVTGKIIRADGSGIKDVKVTFSFVQFAPYRVTRNISESFTNQNGEYEIKGFIKDRELGTLNNFRISVDINSIENSLGNDYLKPSELIPETAPSVNEIIIDGINNRDPIEIVDFIVPLKSDLTINLNNFQPVGLADRFGFNCKAQYGFADQKFPVIYQETSQINSQFNFVTGQSENTVNVFKIKNNMVEPNIRQNVNITSNPSNQELSFDY
jgi:hypothetical protein